MSDLLGGESWCYRTSMQIAHSFTLCDEVSTIQDSVGTKVFSDISFLKYRKISGKHARLSLQGTITYIAFLIQSAQNINHNFLRKEICQQYYSIVYHKCTQLNLSALTIGIDLLKQLGYCPEFKDLFSDNVFNLVVPLLIKRSIQTNIDLVHLEVSLDFDP